jgi:hypothetical protein
MPLEVTSLNANTRSPLARCQGSQNAIIGIFLNILATGWMHTVSSWQQKHSLGGQDLLFVAWTMLSLHPTTTITHGVVEDDLNLGKHYIKKPSRLFHSIDELSGLDDLNTLYLPSDDQKTDQLCPRYLFKTSQQNKRASRQRERQKKFRCSIYSYIILLLLFSYGMREC